MGARFDLADVIPQVCPRNRPGDPVRQTAGKSTYDSLVGPCPPNRRERHVGLLNGAAGGQTAQVHARGCLRALARGRDANICQELSVSPRPRKRHKCLPGALCEPLPAEITQMERSSLYRRFVSALFPDLDQFSTFFHEK